MPEELGTGKPLAPEGAITNQLSTGDQAGRKDASEEIAAVEVRGSRVDPPIRVPRRLGRLIAAGLGALAFGTAGGAVAYGGMYPESASLSVQDYCDRHHPGRTARVYDAIWGCFKDPGDKSFIEVDEAALVREQVGPLAVPHRSDSQNAYTLRGRGFLRGLFDR